MSNTIIAMGVVGLAIRADIMQLDLDKIDNKEPINIYMNTAGGLVSEGDSIMTILELQKQKGNEIVLHIAGMVGSAGSYIAMAADKVIAYPRSKFFIHSPLTTAKGNGEELEKVANNLKSHKEIYIEYYAKKTKKDKNYIEKAMQEETTYFGKQIVEEGFADEYLEDMEVSALNENEALALQGFVGKNEPIIQTQKEKVMSKNEQLTLHGVSGLNDLKNSDPLAFKELSSKVKAELENDADFRNKIKAELKAEQAKVEEDRIKSLEWFRDINSKAVDDAIAKGLESTSEEFKNMLKTPQAKMVENIEAQEEVEVDVKVDEVNAESSEEEKIQARKQEMQEDIKGYV